MKKLNRIIDRFWGWYDNMDEPYRFLFAIVVLSSPLHISTLSGNFLWMSLFLPILITRWFWLNKNNGL
jgi:hypothetical protein